tara:strand:- start:203 stop:475 length:273 start_codon:yes stop_codon:yes gene_type:complete
MKHDQIFGGSFNAHKNWKKLRAKHEKVKKGEQKWRPEDYTPSNEAGKGDIDRSMDVPKEIYALNYDLAFGRITEKEHAERVKAFWENIDK